MSLGAAYGMKRKKMMAGGQVESGYQSMPDADEVDNDAADKQDLFGDALIDGLVDRVIHRFSEGGEVGGGGKVGGASTSTTGNKTKTGGSNPGGASTGGAGTVTITTGNKPPQSISVSDVGGRTAARNAGGMDPGDEEEGMAMASGGKVLGLRERALRDDLVDQEIRRFSEGGKVANSGSGEVYDDLVQRDDLTSTYGEYDNAGDSLGNAQESEDRADIIARIMRQRKMKQTNPRPA